MPQKTFALLAVLAILMGKGLGWFGSGANGKQEKGSPVPDNRPVAANTAARSDVLPDAQRGSNDTSVGAAMASEGAKPNQPPRSGEAMAASQRAAVPSAPLAESRPLLSPSAGADADRFGSLVCLLQTHTAEQQFGRAMSALRRLRSLPLDVAQQTALVQPAAELENALAAACSGVVQAICAGQVLGADRRVQLMLDDDQELVAPILGESLRLCGLPGSLRGLPAQDGAPWPVAKPLAKNRVVRAQIGETTVSGRVVDSTSDRVTLRVQREQAVTFPTVAVVMCEPVEPSPAEAVEMSLAALHAGRGALARLWMACATVRTGTAADPERRDRVQQLLR